uniref:Single domain-containing protein n=1 Tax=Timema cristinae TaxID=61476 RepID=A0A7R9GX06_TIMCR|nr:unnamed protein product [Timema cristinae]
MVWGKAIARLGGAAGGWAEGSNHLSPLPVRRTGQQLDSIELTQKLELPVNTAPLSPMRAGQTRKQTIRGTESDSSWLAGVIQCGQFVNGQWQNYPYNQYERKQQKYTQLSFQPPSYQYPIYQSPYEKSAFPVNEAQNSLNTKRLPGYNLAPKSPVYNPKLSASYNSPSPPSYKPLLAYNQQSPSNKPFPDYNPSPYKPLPAYSPPSAFYKPFPDYNPSPYKPLPAYNPLPYSYKPPPNFSPNPYNSQQEEESLFIHIQQQPLGQDPEQELLSSTSFNHNFPNKCFDNKLNQAFDVNTRWSRHGECSEFICGVHSDGPHEGSIFINAKGCGDVSPPVFQAKCRTINDPNAKFPACCPKLQCFGKK